MKTHQILPLLSAALFTSALTTQAAISTWTGDTNTDYSTATNWDPSGVPNLAIEGNEAIVGGTTIYDAAGGDYTVQNLSRLVVANGGSFTQTNGIAWMNFLGGRLLIQSGGRFSTGTAQNLLRSAATQINVNGSFDYGIGNFSTDSVQFGTFTVGSGAKVDISGEFNLGSDFTFNSRVKYTGGSVITALTSTQILTIDGASLSVVDNAPSIAGFFGFGGITNYVDFTLSGGTIALSNVNGGATEISNAITSGMFRYNGAIDPTNITFADLGGNNFQINAIPEPSSIALLTCLALGALMLRRRRS